MKKSALLFVFALTVSATAWSQSNIVKSLEHLAPGQGKVTIHQDARIEALIGQRPTVSATGERSVIKRNGYRIQVYAGNNTRTAKNEAHEVAARIKEHFPDLAVYATFNPPRWLCRAGDFRSIEEADAMMRQMRATGVFKEVSIVKDQVNIQL